MITRLSIQGMAIIDSLSIDFSPGFNVITGETGAGKSILIRGLNFLMGAKVSVDAVRQGSAHATVTGEFVVPEGHPALDALDKLGIEADETSGGFAILIRRQLTAKGRSQSWVNDVSVTSQPLRELGATLVDVFGQHENQRLMDEAQHIRYIDQFLADKGYRLKLDQLNRECLESLDSLRTTIRTFHERYRNQDYLKFRLDELIQFEPSEEDFDRLKQFCDQSDRVVASRDKLARVLSCLDGGEGENGVSKAVWDAAKLLSGSDPELEAMREKISAIASDLDDVSFELGKRLSALDVSDEDLEKSQARLFGYQDLCRKLAVSDVKALVGERERLEVELTFLESASAQLESALLQLAKKSVALREAAKLLTAAREKTARQTKKRVETELHELAMPGSIFEIRFTPVQRTIADLDLSPFSAPLEFHWRTAKENLERVGEKGSEQCEFLLASNPGEPILSLTGIASGGELSRIMLALKKALAADAETCVLVFDEIDTGISGRVADVVGRKMQELAGSFQVICISHLPQVAAYADTHFLVRKAGKEKRTESTIVKLSRDESAREIARLLSGAEVSAPSLQNAKNLLAKARGKAGKARAGRPVNA